MAVTTTAYLDVTQLIASMLKDVEGLRTHWYVADITRPPACVIGQPEIDYADPEASFCNATYTVPLTIVVARSNDRDAQSTMSRLLADIATTLNRTPPDGVFAVEPQYARPLEGGVLVAGQELPGYSLTVRVRA